MSDIVFGSELPIVKTVSLSGPLSSASITFLPEPAWIKVVLPDVQDQPYGMISGAEGQGSEILFMEDGALGELVLELRPREVVEVLNLPLVDALRLEMDTRRTPGRLLMEAWSREPLVADLVGVSPELDLAVFSFCGWMEVGSEPWREELDDLRLVAVARGVTIGLSNRGHIGWVAVEGFLQRQQVLSVVIDADRHAGAGLEALNSLHRCYYASRLDPDVDRSCSTVRERLSDALLGDAEFMTVFDRLAYSYRSEP